MRTSERGRELHRGCHGRRGRSGWFGRVLCDDDGSVSAIVEDADATDAERRVTEINTGILAAPAVSLKRLLAGLGNDNAQGEFYLTDIVAAAQSAGVPVRAIKAPSFDDFARRE